MKKYEKIFWSIVILIIGLIAIYGFIEKTSEYIHLKEVCTFEVEAKVIDIETKTNKARGRYNWVNRTDYYATIQYEYGTKEYYIKEKVIDDTRGRITIKINPKNPTEIKWKKKDKESIYSIIGLGLSTVFCLPVGSFMLFDEIKILRKEKRKKKRKN